ncbi:MAG: hypothetical protein ACAH80_01140 [Alphaproteobacteria bacterium]
MISEALPQNIARTQWNNRLKSAAMMLLFLFGIFIFALTLVAMFVIPVSLFSGDPSFRLDHVLENARVQWQVLKFFIKILLFCTGAAMFFIWKNISRVGAVMGAQPLKLQSTEPFWRELETLCISRGLSMPDLFMFENRTVPRTLVTAAIMQGVGGKWALVVSEGAYRLKPDLRQALLAQAVQRIHTGDMHFLTFFCFLGYFPAHISLGTNKAGRILFKIPLAAADMFMKLFRKRLLDLRLARLDMGAVELTKQAEPMRELMKLLPTHAEVEKYFFEPYLSLFIARSEDGYREKVMA